MSFGEDKPDFVLMTQAFSLWVKLPGRSRLVCGSLLEAGSTVVEITVDRNMGSSMVINSSSQTLLILSIFCHQNNLP